MGITTLLFRELNQFAVQRHLQILPQIFRIDLPKIWSM
jgi:hypothetical protein